MSHFMAERLFRVIFNGEITGDFSEAETRRKFAELFRLDEARTKAAFSGEDVVLRKAVNRDAAMKYLFALAEIGCECYMEEIIDSDEEGEDEPSIENERRSGRERRKALRREPRAGAVVPDRRTAIRRKIDMKQFREMVEAGEKLPIEFRAYSKNLLKES